LPARPVIGRAGVRTRSALALAVGSFDRHGGRRAVLGMLRDCALRRGEIGRAAEVLTPVLHDPPSAVPLIVLTVLMLTSRHRAAALADSVVQSYRITPEAIAVVRTTKPEKPGADRP
jgi:hypothetical protein